MDVAILLNQRDAELFLLRPRKGKANIIASGVDTFVYLEQRRIRYQRLTRYFDLRKTKAEWDTARNISDRFLHQPFITSLYGAPRLKPWGPKIPSFAKASEGYPPHYMGATSAEASFRIHPRVNPWFSAKADKKNIDYRYPIHQLLKYLLTDIVRNQGIAEKILTKNKPAICYISNTLTEPLVQKLHNQEFTLFNHVLIQLCKHRNIQVCLIQNRHYFHYLKLMEIISKLFVQTIINAGRSVIKKYSFQKHSNQTKQTILFSASVHLLTNTRRLIRRLERKWNVIVVGKLKQAEETKYTQTDVMFVPLNTLIRHLSFADLFSNLVLTSQIFIGFLLLPKKIKQSYFDKALGVPLWHILGPSLGLYSSLLVYEVTLYSKYIQWLWKISQFNFILASNNIDPFHFALLSFARRRQIPYALLIHDAQGNTFSDFFFQPTDTLFVWGNFQKRIMKKDFPRLDCIVTGHPNFDNIVTLSKENQPISRLILKKRLKILVLSTYNPYIQFPNQEVLFDVFGELDKIKKYKISVTLKSHPSENHARLVQLTQNFIRYPLRWSQENAETLLQEHNLIITQSTSAGFWAILLHKPTIYLNIHELKDYEPYAKTGAALGVYYLHQLNPAIEALIKYPRLCEKNQTIFIKDFCYKRNEEASLRIYKYIQTKINSL